MSDVAHAEREVEALLFAAAGPLSEAEIAQRLPEGADVAGAIAALRARYEGRGVQLVCVAERWRFQTAEDLAWLMTEERQEPRRLSRAAQETLAIVAYHQPVTRAEIEAVRGVQASKGTLDVLLELGLVRMRGRRRTPGRPIDRPGSAASGCRRSRRRLSVLVMLGGRRHFSCSYPRVSRRTGLGVVRALVTLALGARAIKIRYAVGRRKYGDTKLR